MARHDGALRDSAFSGEGARVYGGRWNPKGYAVVYTAESRSFALLEMLVQDDPPRARYVLIPARFPDALKVTAVEIEDLPRDLRLRSARAELQAIHPDFGKLDTGTPEPLETDVRLIRNLAR